jgi:hypothetical protein
MSNIRTFKISDRTFSGYSVDLNLNYYDSMEEICLSVKNNLVIFLKENNLEILEQKAKGMHLHIHDYTIEHILTSNNNTIFWCCSHC